MKIKCEHCDKDLKVNVSKSLEQFEVGKIICPHCNKENKRYLSESDLLMYFGGMIVIYCFGLILSFQIWNIFVFTIAIICLILMLVLAFLSSNLLVKKIYVDAIFKQDYKNTIFDEDVSAVKKNLKRQFILFLLVALMFGSQPGYTLYALLLIVVFFLIIAVKTRLCIRNERAIITNKKDHKNK